MVESLPFHVQFISGAVAGVTEIITMYPLDGKNLIKLVIKTRFQLQKTKNEMSILQCFKKIIKDEGVKRLYRGMLAPVIIEAPKRATKFAANEQFGGFYRNLFQSSDMTQPLSIITGMSAGVTEALIVVSFELVKIRLQDPKNLGKYTNTIDCIRKIFLEEGALSLFQGLEATIFRHASWNGGYFGTIYAIKKKLPKGNTHSQNLFLNFVAGSIGGTIGTILNTPFDVAKTRIQNQIGKEHKIPWTLPFLRNIALNEGFFALYKGFVPKVLRLGPGGGILLVVFETVSGLFKKMYHNTSNY